MITVTVEERELMNDMIVKSKTCYISMIDTEGFPYVIPMNFGFENDILYFHSAQEGSSIKALEAKPDVCILFCSDPTLVYQHQEVACSYRMRGSSIMCRGKVIFEENNDEKIKALDIIMRQYTKRKFTYSQPAIENVKIWKVEIDDISFKIFGAINPKSKHYKDQNLSDYY